LQLEIGCAQTSGDSAEPDGHRRTQQVPVASAMIPFARSVAHLTGSHRELVEEPAVS
jgi:hypothetical protein